MFAAICPAVRLSGWTFIVEGPPNATLYFDCTPQNALQKTVYGYDHHGLGLTCGRVSCQGIYLPVDSAPIYR
jgi:hypothetical protein